MNALCPTLIAAMLTLSSAVTLSLHGQSPVGAAPATKLGSGVFKWEDLVDKPTDVGRRRDVVNLPTATLARFECHISTLNAGLASHPPHRHPQEEFIIIKEGTLDVSINGRTQRVGPGTLFFFAANEYHNVQNADEATMLRAGLLTAA